MLVTWSIPDIGVNNFCNDFINCSSSSPLLPPIPLVEAAPPPFPLRVSSGAINATKIHVTPIKIISIIMRQFLFFLYNNVFWSPLLLLPSLPPIVPFFLLSSSCFIIALTDVASTILDVNRC